jgi:hypothetical protein
VLDLHVRGVRAVSTRHSLREPNQSSVRKPLILASRLGKRLGVLLVFSKPLPLHVIGQIVWPIGLTQTQPLDPGEQASSRAAGSSLDASSPRTSTSCSHRSSARLRLLTRGITNACTITDPMSAIKPPRTNSIAEDYDVTFRDLSAARDARRRSGRSPCSRDGAGYAPLEPALGAFRGGFPSRGGRGYE